MKTPLKYFLPPILAFLFLPFPSFAALELAADITTWPQVHDCIEYNSKLYFSVSAYLSTQNGGDIVEHDPASGAYQKVYTVNEQGSGLLYNFNGKIYAPGNDAQESWDFGNFYTFDGTTWQKHRTIPSAVHVFEMAYLNGTLYAIAQAKDAVYNQESILYSSMDDGATWIKGVNIGKPAGVYLGGLASYNGKIYVFGTDFVGKGYLFSGSGSSWTVKDTMPWTAVKPQKAFMEFMGNLYIGTTSGLYKMDSSENVQKVAAFGDKVIQDFTVFNGELYAAVFDSVIISASQAKINIYSSSDGNSWTLKYVQPLDSPPSSIQAFYLGVCVKGYQNTLYLGIPTLGKVYKDTLAPANNAPVLGAIGGKSVNENSLLSFNISATDADGDTLTYSASGLPAGAALSGQAFSWTPTYSQAGSYSVIFSVSDGKGGTDSEIVTIMVSNTNRAPVLSAIGNKSSDENTLLSFTISAADADGDALTYSASNLPAGASFNVSTRTFSWTPSFSQAGVYINVRFTVSDGSLTDYEDITITINDVVVNSPPVLNVIGNKSVNEGSLLQFAVFAADADGDTLTYSASGLPAGASFNASTRTFSWTPTYSQAGSHNVTFSVSDGKGGSDSEAITITVNDVNQAPVLSAIGNKSLDENNLLSFSVSASDADGDTLTYSASALPAGAALSGQAFSWTPTYAQAGSYSVIFSVSDGKGGNDSEAITITVNDVVLDANVPSRSNGQPTGTLVAGTTGTTISLATNESATCRYSISAGITYDAMTGSFSVTGGMSHSTPVTGLQNGQNYTYYIRCSDSSFNKNVDDFVINFSVDSPNNSPVLSLIGNKTIYENSLLSFTVSAADADGDTLTYSASGLPAGASFNASTRTFSWTPTFSQAGSYSVTFSVSDGKGGGDSEAITIAVNDVVLDANAPVRSDGQPTGTLTAGTVQATINLTTNEPAVCKYSTSAGTSYDAMTGNFSATGGISHSVLAVGLQNGSNYAYYARCSDSLSNKNTDDFAINFSVALPTFSLSSTDQPYLLQEKAGLLRLSGTSFDLSTDFRLSFLQNSTAVSTFTFQPKDSSTLELSLSSAQASSLPVGFYDLKIERTTDSASQTFSKQILITKLGDLWSPTATESSEQKRDGRVDVYDASRLLSKWGSANAADLQEYDINSGPNNISQGKIDLYDANKLMANWRP